MAPKISRLSLSILFLVLIQALVAQSRTLKPNSQPFKFPQNQEGSQRGHTVKGLNEIKQYLKKLGYYPNDLDGFIIGDYFDDDFESALKTYQNNYRLNVTGSLDSDTLNEIMIPRCGVPDPINHPTKPTGKEEDKNRSSKFHMVSQYTFFGGMPKWPSSKTHLTYSFHSSVQVIDLPELSSVCSRAFQRWADVTQFTFEELPVGADSDIVIRFQRGDHGDGDHFSGLGNILAHAFAPTDGRLDFNSQQKWSSNPTMDEVDLESVTIHQIGHLLGLAHSMDQNSIMFAEIPPGTIKRDLTQEDIDGIHALYSN